MSPLESPVCPLSSPCLWGKLKNLSFSKVSKFQTCSTSRAKCSFGGSQVSPLESLAFLWRRQTCPCQRFRSFQSGGNLARNARFEAPTCLLLSPRLSCGVGVSLGEAAKLVVCEGVQISNLAQVSQEMLVLS